MGKVGNISFEKFVEHRYFKTKKYKESKENYFLLTDDKKDDYRRNVMHQLAMRINFLLDREFINRDGYCAVPVNLNINEKNIMDTDYPKSVYEIESMQEDLAHIIEVKKEVDRDCDMIPDDIKEEKREYFEWLKTRGADKYHNYMERKFYDFPVGKIKMFLGITAEEYELFDLLLEALPTNFMRRKNKKWEDVNIKHRIRILELLRYVVCLPNWEYVEIAIDDIEKKLLFPELYRVEKLTSFITEVVMTKEGSKQYFIDETIRALLNGAEKKLDKIHNLFEEKEVQEKVAD